LRPWLVGAVSAIVLTGSASARADDVFDPPSTTFTAAVAAAPQSPKFSLDLLSSAPSATSASPFDLFPEKAATNAPAPAVAPAPEPDAAALAPDVGELQVPDPTGLLTPPDAFASDERRSPNVLRAPDERAPLAVAQSVPFPDTYPYFMYPVQSPIGFTGQSGVQPRERQQSSHFVLFEDRWRMGFPQWDRYGRGHPLLDDYPYDPGRFLNPYKQNVLKGDYPVVGQHTFMNLTVSNQLIYDYRQVPTPQNPQEVTQNPNGFAAFGNPNQNNILNTTSFSLDLSHGDAAFKPADWRIRVTPVVNENYLVAQELGVTAPDVEEGRHRYQYQVSLQEWFAEAKLADLSADYDFLSVRVGSQPFVSDFRGFLFADTNRAIRFFGTRLSNREQFNLVAFSQQEKDTNSFLNTFANRQQTVLIANYFRQDTIFPGYTSHFSFHGNFDQPSTHYDTDGVLVRPDPAGVFQEHRVNAYYLGWGGDGHINRLNISHQFYQVFGVDSFNPIGGQRVNISAQMAACELSYDRDWVRFRTSVFWASGEDNPFGTTAHGFDAIFDNPNFAGGAFSYWQRQSIRLQGVNLTNRNSLLPNLRSSKTQGQANFMNPGLRLFNAGMDFDVSQKVRLITNANFLWFDQVGVLRQFIFQNQVDRHIGTDISLGTEYRPLLSNNVILTAGVSSFLPGSGFHDIYDNLTGRTPTLYAAFTELILTY
jgi:hypothetical protein